MAAAVAVFQRWQWATEAVPVAQAPEQVLAPLGVSGVMRWDRNLRRRRDLWRGFRRRRFDRCRNIGLRIWQRWPFWLAALEHHRDRRGRRQFLLPAVVVHGDHQQQQQRQMQP